MAALWIRSDALVLSQIYSCLAQEVACLMKAYSVTFRIQHSLTDRKIIGLSSVAVPRGALEMLDSLLLEIRYFLR